MTAEAVDGAPDQTPLTDMLEERIELLQTLGLPLEFSSGLLELADNSQNDRERRVILGSLELLLKARQTAPVSKPEPVSYLSRARSLVRIPEVSDEEIESEVADSFVQITFDQMPEVGPEPTKKAEKFIKKLTGMAELPPDITQQEIVSFVDGLIQLYPTVRKRGGRPTSKTLFAEVKLHIMGHADQEIEKLLQHQVIASKMSAKREGFIRLFHERGYDEQTLAARFLSERVREKSLRTDGVELPLQAERLTYFSKRISEMSNGVELSISEPLTEDEALGLVNAYAFSDLRSGSGERFALRLARLLKGMSYDTVAELESIDTDETVKSGAVQVFLSANAPKFAAKYLSSLESTSAAEPISTIVSEQTHEPHTEPYQIETPQTESVDTSTVDEAPVTEEINPVEQSAPERFDLETAQIRILELQTDGEKRHADGSLDAQDIESIYGVKAKRVRAMAHDIIFQLSSQGKHIKCPGRKRQYGQITEHYNHVILDVLLPEVAKLSLQPDETL